MQVIIIASISLFVLPIMAIIIYGKIMLRKKQQFSTLNFSTFKNEINSKRIDEMEKMVNETIKNANDWITLSAFFMSLYYLFNIWSIIFLSLNLFIAFYYNELNLSTEILRICIVAFSALSVIFSSLDIWLNTKEKSKRFHANWFITTQIIRKYIIEISNITEYQKLCDITNSFIDNLHNSIKNTDFFN